MIHTTAAPKTNPSFRSYSLSSICWLEEVGAQRLTLVATCCFDEISRCFQHVRLTALAPALSLSPWGTDSRVSSGSSGYERPKPLYQNCRVCQWTVQIIRCSLPHRKRSAWISRPGEKLTLLFILAVECKSQGPNKARDKILPCSYLKMWAILPSDVLSFDREVEAPTGMHSATGGHQP
jgi:hypothetical protein